MNAADDWKAFAGREHMFFGIDDPYGMIRECLEEGLKRQVPDTVVESIITEGEPKFLTIGKRSDDPANVIVAHYAFCVAATVTVRFDEGRQTHTMAAALTFAFARVDEPGEERMRTWFDLDGDVERGMADDTFERRFLAFRAEHVPPDA